MRGIHRRRVNSPHKWPVTRKRFPFDDVIIYMIYARGMWLFVLLNYLIIYSCHLTRQIFHQSKDLIRQVGAIVNVESCISNPLQWRHKERDGVSNHPRLYWLLNRLFRRRSKKTSKLHVTGLCKGNPPMTDGFSSQRASNAENVSIWWRHLRLTLLRNKTEIMRAF